MNLWSLLLPFKLFIIGVGVFLGGIFNLLKRIIFFLGSLCKYLIKGIIIVFKSVTLKIASFLLLLFRVLKKGIIFVFLYTFKGIMTIIKTILLIPLYIYKGIKIIGQNISKPFIYFHKQLSKFMKNIGLKCKAFFKWLAGIPDKIKEKYNIWFNNLSFIKDRKNRTEMKRESLLIDFDASDSMRSDKKMNYHYVAKTADGKMEKGYLGAFSKLDVHSYLLAEGYEVYEIKIIKGLSFGQGIGSHKIKIAELVFFLTQLSTYIKAGIPLVDSIKILGKQASKSNTKFVYKAIVYDLTMGDSFSEALSKQGVSFPKLLTNMVKSAELTGNLTETLDDMAEYYTSMSKTIKQMKSALTYPAVILVFASSVVVFILTFVIPSFVTMYRDADAEVPAITTFVINLSDFLTKNALWLVFGLVVVSLCFYYMYKNIKVFRTFIQWLMMHSPIMGKIIIYNEVTMFSKTFASLWSHNVFITDSMEILSKITNNEIFKMLIFDAITNVARGEPVSTSFKDNWVFPTIAYEMLLTGERTGQPGPMMDKVAEFYQEEHRNAINQVKAFIEPALIITLSFVVGVILLSVVIPMFSIYGQLGLE